MTDFEIIAPLVPYDDAKMRGLLSQMPEHQRVRVSAMSHPRRRQERVAAYMLLMRLLQRAQRFVEPPVFAIGPHGKPYLVNYPALHFNLSHCAQGVALAVSDESPVGIDIECRRAVSKALIRRVCNDDEMNEIHQSADPESEFLRIWTRKEALLKYLGTGIACNLQPLLSATHLDSLGVTIDTRPLPNIDGWLSLCYKATL